MLMFLYDLPNWLMGAVISVFFVIVTLASYALFRRVVRHEFSEDDKGMAMSMLSVIATINALLLAFSAVSVWESFGAADEAVVQEADTISELALDLAVFDSEQSREARQLLRQYAQAVVNDEWPAMRVGEEDEAAWTLFDRTFRTVATMEPDTARRGALMPEVWAKINELLGHRRDRLYVSKSEVPGTLWTVVVVGTVLTMLITFVLPPTRFNTTIIGSLAFSMGLVFYFIVAMDRPFAGQESISPDPFNSAVESMQRWDEER